jgi:predicted TIM-barrel fold metal-dependent hydrolase
VTAAGLPAAPLTDVHVHLAALPTPENGCLLSRRMLRSPLTRFLAWQQGLPLHDAETANRRYLERLERELSASERVGRAVLLAMDGVYDAAGRLDEARTDFLISNDHLFAVTQGRPHFLPGVSVNPARRDAVDELERCAEKGAVLVKVLPNAQAFDPADPRFVPFYAALARLGLPLLTHVGYEFSLIGQDQSVGDVSRMVAALDQGVTVIAAHGCSSGLFFREPHFPTMLDLARRYPNFFVDTSALTIPNRVGALFRLRRHPELFDRLVFGTDYPLPVWSYPCLGVLDRSGFARAWKATNRFDRQETVLKSLNVSCEGKLPGLLGIASPR